MGNENLFIKQVMIGPMMNYGYIVGNKETKKAAVIDPGWEAHALIDEAGKDGFEITHVLATHSHFDHVNEVPVIMDRLGAAKLYIHADEAGAFADMDRKVLLHDGDTINLGNLSFRVIHVPGHTKGSVAFLIGDALFTGDTLFVDGIGRTDLEGGDTGEMFGSIKKLAALPDKTIVYPGHHYGPAPVSTIGEQKKTNSYMRCSSLGDFFRMA